MKFVEKYSEVLKDIGYFYGNPCSDLFIFLYILVSSLYSFINAFILYRYSKEEEGYKYCHDLVIYNYFLSLSMIITSVKTYILFKFNNYFKLTNVTKCVILNFKINSVITSIFLISFIIKF